MRVHQQSPVREALSTSNVGTLLKHHQLTSMPTFVRDPQLGSADG